MSPFVDEHFFKDLIHKDAEDVCKRAQCEYDPNKKCYTLLVWGDVFVIFPFEMMINKLTNRIVNIHRFSYLLIIQYLLNSKKTRILNEWISEKDLLSGVTFFQGPHSIPTQLISSRFKGNIEGFKKRCMRLQGAPLGVADAAYVFTILPRIPVAVLFWDGDDEFPAESKLLFDRSIADHFDLDIIFALAVTVCTTIGGHDQ